MVTHIIEKYIYKLETRTRAWSYLAMNPNAIYLIEKNLDKLDISAWR